MFRTDNNIMHNDCPKYLFVCKTYELCDGEDGQLSVHHGSAVNALATRPCRPHHSCERAVQDFRDIYRQHW